MSQIDEGAFASPADARASIAQAAPEALAATHHEAIFTPEYQAAVARLSIEQLKARNVPGGYWVAGAEREAAFAELTLMTGFPVLTLDRLTRDRNGRRVEWLRMAIDPTRAMVTYDGLPLTHPAW
jgi:hypothetical protein